VEALFEPWEADALRPPPDENIVDWAERCIVLPRSTGTPMPGPLDLSVTPYLKQPLLDATNPDVEEITLVWCTQAGKTMSMLLVALACIGRDPWNFLWASGREEDATDICMERFQPIIRESPVLAKLLTGSKSDMIKNTIRLNGINGRFVGAHSPLALASRGAPVVLADELDKWPEWSAKEAEPLKLLRERTSNFDERKILKASTPRAADGYISRELQESSNCRYHVPCARCGAYQELVLGDKGEGTPGIKWPEEIRDPEKIIRYELAWYECAHCHGRIEEPERMPAVREGLWVPKGCHITGNKVIGEAKSLRHTGYHLWAAYSFSPKRTLHYIAAEFLRSVGRSASWMNFKNSWLAQGWSQEVNKLEGHEIRERCADYVQGVVPVGGWVITAGVDVQESEGQTYLYYVLRAWGAEEESWLVKCGRIESWDALTTVLFHSTYRDPKGRPIPIVGIFVDSGFKTPEVYDYCAEMGVVAVKGDSRLREPSKLSKGKSGGRIVQFVLVDTDHYKTMFHRLVRSQKWHIPGDVPGDYYRHLVAEQLVQVIDKPTGKSAYRWRLVSDSLPNHYLDCEVYALAGADTLQMRNRSTAPPVPKKRTGRRGVPAPNRVDIYK
jgi:phage terminase large subunit GpA-like protein